MPNGSLVAGFQKRALPNGQVNPEIVFWERNGLRHGEFDLPKAQDSASTEVFQMRFNLESTVLAVHCSIDGQAQILLYTRSNWKWYCKQQVLICETNPLIGLQWIKKYQLCLLRATGSLEFIEYRFDYMTSNTNCNLGKDFGYVAVVDGPAINLTPMGNFVMPPPMFEKQIVLPFVPKSVSLFGHAGVAFIDKEESLFTFDCETVQLKRFNIASILKSAQSAVVTQVINCATDRVFIWLSAPAADTILLLRLNEDGSVEVIARHELDSKVQRVCLDSSVTHTKTVAEHSNENDYYIERASAKSVPIAMMNFNAYCSDDVVEDSLGLIVQTLDKSVHKLKLEENFFQEDLLFTSGHHYIKMQAAKLSGKEVIIGLTATLRLYINGHLFSNECTCFALHENFLLFVNSTSGLMHELFIYDLNKRLPRPVAGLGAEDQPPQLASLDETGNFNVRAVERGSRIVVAHGYKTVLQMPRGNLETI